MDAGGVFVYANGLINMLLKEDRIEKLVVFYTRHQADHVGKIAPQSDRLSLVEVNIQNNPWLSFWAKAYNLCDSFYEAFTPLSFGKKFFKGLNNAFWRVAQTFARGIIAGPA